MVVPPIPAETKEWLCPRCRRPDCETATELYAHIVGDAQGDELSFWTAHAEYTATMLFQRGWAGTKTAIEKRFHATHVATLSPARQAQRARRAEQMRGFAARRRNATMGNAPQRAEGSEAVSVPTREEYALRAHVAAARGAA